MATWTNQSQNTANWSSVTENAATWNVVEEGGTAWPYNDSAIYFNDARTLVRYNSWGGATSWSLQTEN